MDHEKLREGYRAEGWGLLAEAAGFDPVHTETSAREAFRWCHSRMMSMQDVMIAAAAQCDDWAVESRRGGWSTHQVEANRRLAESLRQAALNAVPASD